MKKYILDASFILNAQGFKFPLVHQRLSEVLHEVKRSQATIHAPFFLVFEISNALRYAYKDQNIAQEIFQYFLQLPLRTHHLANHHLVNILYLSYQLDTSFYDTTYHFMAKIQGGIFLTCDKEYYNKAKSLKDIELVRLG